MKKITVLMILLLFSNIALCNDNLSFVYINGANNNDNKMKTWYETGVSKLHYELKKSFLKNKKFKKYFPKLSSKNLKDEPVIFFWGYNSHNDITKLKKQIKLSKMLTAPGAYLAKIFLTDNLHDTIWIQKPHNMIPVLEDLDKTLKKEADKGNDVIMYGYSAGAFVAYEYMFNKLKYINVKELFEKLNADKELMQTIEKYPENNTCISALSRNFSDIITTDTYGNYVLNTDTDLIKKNIPLLKDLTVKACAPDNIRGTVYFASPLPLFYSDLFDAKYNLNYLNGLMIKYILENEMFILTVNFREDPMGFSTSQNLTPEEIGRHLRTKINNPKGIIYNNSEVWAKRLFIFSHISYWSARKSFAKAVPESLVNGYRFQYDKAYRDKLKKNERNR